MSVCTHRERGVCRVNSFPSGVGVSARRSCGSPAPPHTTYLARACRRRDHHRGALLPAPLPVTIFRLARERLERLLLEVVGLIGEAPAELGRRRPPCRSSRGCQCRRGRGQRRRVKVPLIVWAALLEGLNPRVGRRSARGRSAAGLLPKGRRGQKYRQACLPLLRRGAATRSPRACCVAGGGGGHARDVTQGCHGERRTAARAALLPLRYRAVRESLLAPAHSLAAGRLGALRARAVGSAGGGDTPADRRCVGRARSPSQHACPGRRAASTLFLFARGRRGAGCCPRGRVMPPPTRHRVRGRAPASPPPAARTAPPTWQAAAQQAWLRARRAAPCRAPRRVWQAARCSSVLLQRTNA